MFKLLMSLPRAAAVGKRFHCGSCASRTTAFVSVLRRCPTTFASYSVRPPSLVGLRPAIVRWCHSKPPAEDQQQQLTPAEKLKKAAKEYGSVLVAFHVGISLISLGTVYSFMLYGVDVQQWIEKLGMSGADDSAKIVAGASQFIIAYAIHKSFAPVRISITLVSVPLIVRYLRAKGIMKAKK